MIFVKTPEEVDMMAQAGRIFSYKAKPAFKGYRGFPATLCTSINEQIVHGVPSKRQLKEGDILSLDIGLVYQEFYADMAVTLPIGPVSEEAQKLIQVTKKALRKAISRVKPGKTIGDISFAIQKHIQADGFQVVRELCGHGLGRQLHEKPDIPNFGYPHKGPFLEEGMVIAIEPMAVLGQPGIKKGPDGFCYQTADNSLSAHFEHSVAVTKKGPRILTE